MLFYTLSSLKTNEQFLETYLEYFDIQNDMYQGSLSVEKRSDKQFDIEFKNVSFRYSGSEDFALKDINLNLKVGERLAVVGQNGSGKTTFIKLLCRLYDPTEGEIHMNDFNVRKYDYRQYLDLFSVVFQDYNLLAMPLGNNVASAEKWDAIKAEQMLYEVGFGERYEEMPKKLETSLYKNFDEEGVNISGGEAQKIALARALYKDAPFIILDEPTAALDPIAEAEIYSKFDEIVGDKTAIYISHRLSSCRFCDKIAVFDQGRIVQVGTHEELLENTNGKYYELWNAQASYYA
ncbi:MAG: ATP-binding cassette domain-containing protein [Lachnospiraceae bacterium]|nr:ATP-binding cassette domain-containing protein [Lachnospiraceae bacterium]